VATAVWGLLLIWTGAALLLHWGWGVGLVGAGVVLLVAQAVRSYLDLRVDGFGLVAGAVLVICGLGNLTRVAVDVVPVLFIVAGIALVASIWPSRGRRRAHGRPVDPQAPSHRHA
jgi:hypothetical protein